MEPARSDKIRLNKVAFFVEFGYLHKSKRELSSAKYAGIDLGPVIDKYSTTLIEMEKEGLVKIDGTYIRLIKTPSVEVPESVQTIIDPLIEKYSKLSKNELIALSHSTDSYLITTDNQKVMGKLIDKDLATLESFFDEETTEIELNESALPKIDKNKLVEYDAR